MLTIASMLGLAYLMNYSGMTSTLGLALAATGGAFPFFSAVVGWLGVFLTGSDTSANALFGNLQVVTANALGPEPDPDGVGELGRRRDGQDDFGAEHRRGRGGDRHDARRREPAVPLHHQAQRAADGGDGRSSRCSSPTSSRRGPGACRRKRSPARSMGILNWAAADRGESAIWSLRRLSLSKRPIADSRLNKNGIVAVWEIQSSPIGHLSGLRPCYRRRSFLARVITAIHAAIGATSGRRARRRGPVAGLRQAGRELAARRQPLDGSPRQPADAGHAPRGTAGRLHQVLERRTVFLVRTGESEVTALDSTCTHLGCRVSWDARASRSSVPVPRRRLRPRPAR